MTDQTAFYRTLIGQVTAFEQSYWTLRQYADRLAKESGLSIAAAAAAQAGGRTDLVTANFDNFRLAMTQLDNLMNTSNANVPNGGVLGLTYTELM
jgi:hypothetical protein